LAQNISLSAIKTYSGSRGRAPLILNLNNRKDATFTHGSTKEELKMQLNRRLARTSSDLMFLWRMEKNSCPTGIES
jgi:hypothetical protein